MDIETEDTAPNVTAKTGLNTGTKILIGVTGLGALFFMIFLALFFDVPYLAHSISSLFIQVFLRLFLS